MSSRPRSRRPAAIRARVVLAAITALVLAAGVVAAVRFVRDLPQRRAVDVVRGAPGKAYDAGSFHATATVTHTPVSGESRSTRAMATVTADARRAHLELFPVLAEDPLEIVSHEDDLYLSIPPLKQQEFAGARWVRVHVESDEAARGAGVGPIPDPLTFLDALEGAVRPVVRGPIEEVGATKARRYDATVTYRRLARSLAPAQARVIGGFGLEEIPMTVWVNGDGLPVRARYQFDLGENGTVVAVIDVSRFGEGILIGIPPRAATFTVGSVEEALRAVGASLPAPGGE